MLVIDSSRILSSLTSAESIALLEEKVHKNKRKKRKKERELKKAMWMEEKRCKAQERAAKKAEKQKKLIKERLVAMDNSSDGSASAKVSNKE